MQSNSLYRSDQSSRSSGRGSNPSLRWDTGSSPQQRKWDSGQSYPFRLGTRPRELGPKFRTGRSMFLPNQSVRGSHPQFSHHQATTNSQPQTVNWKQHYDRDIGRLVEEFENKAKENGKPKKRGKQVTFNFQTLRGRFQKLYNWWQNSGDSDTLRTSGTGDFRHTDVDVELGPHDDDDGDANDGDEPHIFQDGAVPGPAIPAERAEAPHPPQGYQLPFIFETSDAQDYEMDFMKDRQSRKPSRKFSSELSSNWEVPLVLGTRKPQEPPQDSSSSSGASRERYRWDFPDVDSDLYGASTTTRRTSAFYEPSPFLHPLQEESYF